MRNGRYIACKILIILCILFIRAYADAEVTNAAAEKQIGFADSLFEEGDYFRSITEYKRFIFNYPKQGRREQAFFRIAESYYRAQRWSEAEESFKAFTTRFPSGPLCFEALYLKALSEKNQKKYDQAIATLEALIKNTSGQMLDRAVYQKGLAELERAEWKRAEEAFKSVSPGSSLHLSALSIVKNLENADNLPKKNPAVAGVLAAVLPGAGHLYTERPRDAVVSFLLNASFIAAAVQLFRHNNEIAGGIAAFFELGWYSGNIYSAITSAYKYNESAKAEFIEKTKESVPISLKSYPRGLMLMYSFNYY